MQLAIELPDELGEQLLQHGNVTQFVQEAVKKMLLEERQAEKSRPSRTAANKGKYFPITQSLIGILKDSNLDVKDYKNYLEDKHL